jgi:phosphoesterase RecJ-like protein
MDSHSTGIVAQAIAGGSEQLDEELAQAAALIKQHQRIIVASHASPDGDAIGSLLALTHVLAGMGKRAVAYNLDGVPYNFRFLAGAEDVISDRSLLPRDTDLAICLDCSSWGRVDQHLVLDRKQVRTLCIDHHETVDADGFDVFVHDVRACAVGELIYRLIRVLEVPLSRHVAECLYVSIQTDTGSFRYSNTTAGALQAAAELVRAGIDVWTISSEVYEKHPIGRLKLLAHVLDTLHLSSDGRLAFVTVTHEMYQRTGTGPEMLDGFINYARGIAGVEVACQIRESKTNVYRVSFRSRGRVNVAQLAQQFGGGGHHNAAGCTIEGTPQTIVRQLTAELDRILATA